jgi:iron complex transport system permease protein
MAERRIRAPWIAVRGQRLPLSFKFDRRVPLVVAGLLAAAFAVLVLSISYGEYDISPLEVVQTLFGALSADHPEGRSFNLVVHTFRLPRILVAFLVGAALGTAGAIMQGIMRNPLAEPGILGVTAGAGFAAVLILVGLRDAPLALLPWAAFGGALLAAAAIYLFAWNRAGATPVRLVLIGVAVAAALGSLTTFLLVFGDINDVQQAYVWLTGSVYGRNWEHVRTLSAWLLVLLPLAFLSARSLNALHLGDDVAKGFGVRANAQRAFLLLICVGLAAAAVAVAGTIGFVGLIAPHIARRLVGPAHEGMLPVAALFGGVLLVTADLAGRWVIAPSELPIGIIVALIGAPYFLLLLYRYRA